MRKSKALKKRIYEELQKIPVVGQVCKNVGISRQTFYRWKKEDEEFDTETEKAMEEGVSFVSDIAESNLILMLQGQNLPAIRYWLSHRKREYTPILSTRDSRLEDPSKDQLPTQLQISVVTEKQVPDDPDDDEE